MGGGGRPKRAALGLGTGLKLFEGRGIDGGIARVGTLEHGPVIDLKTVLVVAKGRGVKQ